MKHVPSNIVFLTKMMRRKKKIKPQSAEAELDKPVW